VTQRTAYLIFCIWDAFEFVVIYFFTVETKGYSLEEIEEIFDQPSPVKYSKELQKVKREAAKAARGDAEGGGSTTWWNKHRK